MDGSGKGADVGMQQPLLKSTTTWPVFKSFGGHTFYSKSHLSVILNCKNNNHHRHPANAEDVWEKQASLKISSMVLPSLKQLLVLFCFFFFLNDGKPFLTVVGSSPSCDMSELSTALHSEAAWLHAASFRQACRRQCCNFSRKGGWKESPGCNVL